MHDQPISASVPPVADDGPEKENLGEYPVAVLSAAVLRAVREGRRESRDDLARRVRVSVAVVEGVERGTHPAWALPYVEFAALARAAASAPNPRLRGLFETATACDLLLSSVLNGEQALATDVLTDQATRELAMSLLRWAITGQACPLGEWAPVHLSGLLRDNDLTLLRHCATTLAASRSPDAWVGTVILAIAGGGR
jgi:transcriptional regulator with XRE-family HTH domain